MNVGVGSLCTHTGYHLPKTTNPSIWLCCLVTTSRSSEALIPDQSESEGRPVFWVGRKVGLHSAPCSLCQQTGFHGACVVTRIVSLACLDITGICA
jgi:hypothetical protein